MGQMGVGYYPTSQFHGVYNNQTYVNQSYQGAWNQMAQPMLPFLATLNLPDLSWLKNDLVSHDLAWLVIPTKLPLDIPKCEGKASENLGEHITTFHLWCSNSLNHNLFYLRLFQRTLTGPVAKWYIEFPGGTYTSFNDLAMTFLNHFQLPVHYNAGTKLLSTFW